MVRGIDREQLAVTRKAEMDAAYRGINGERRRAYSRTWYVGKENLVASKNARLKLAALNAYGGPRCACCGEALVQGLSIDHVNGDGAEFRREHGNNKGGSHLYLWLKKNNYPPGYQVLCMTCNKAKGTGDHCPHQDAWL